MTPLSPPDHLPRYWTPGAWARPDEGGFWVSDEYLWEVLPGLTPLEHYLYFAVGRYKALRSYPTVRSLAAELSRGPRLVWEAVWGLKVKGLLNEADLRYLMFDPAGPPEATPEPPDDE